MSEKKNLQATRQLFDEVYSGGNLSLLESLISNAIKLHDPSDKKKVSDLKSLIAREEMYTRAFPNKTVIIDEISSSNDTVSVRWTVKGTHERDLPGIPATQKPINITGTSIFKFKNGKIIEIWQNWDELGLLTQLGVYTSPTYAGRH